MIIIIIILKKKQKRQQLTEMGSSFNLWLKRDDNVQLNIWVSDFLNPWDP